MFYQYFFQIQRRPWLHLPTRLLGLLLALITAQAVTLPAHAQGGGNSITTPDASDVGKATSLVLDSNGYPVISYLDINNGDLKVMHCNDPNCAGGDESIATPDPGNLDIIDPLYNTSLVLDSNGYPVIGYYDDESDRIKVVRCNDPNCTGGDESITTAEGTLEPFSEWPSLALDSNGYPVISADGRGLSVLHCNDPNCAGNDESFNVFDDSSLRFSHTSLALDSNGYPVVSYHAEEGKALKVLHCNDPNCAGDDESITLPDIGTDTTVGKWNSLTLDSNGYPVISYLAQGLLDTNRDLKVLHCNDPNCTGGDESISAPDTEGKVGEWTSLVLDNNGYPVISYYDNTNDDLKVMHCNDPNCTGDDETITAPDTGGRVGKWSSLALDSNGYPVISYYDQDNKSLKVLHCGSPDCIIPTDSTPPVITPDVSGTQGDNGWYISDVEVSWTVIDDESTVSTTTGCDTTTIDSDTAGTTLTCEATSDGGTNSASITIQRDATPPTAAAGGPYSVAEGGSIQLDGSSSSNNGAATGALSYAWDLDSDGQYDNATGVNPTFSAADGPNSVTVGLQVTDEGGLTSTDSAVITINNVAPTANAGGDQSVFRNQTVNLSGTWSDPAAADDNAYTWSWDLNGDGTADEGGSASYGETIDRSTSFVVDGVANLTFTVTDKDGASHSDTVQISVVNRVPVANGQNLSTDEDTDLPITVSATDADGDALTYSIASQPSNGTLGGTAPNVIYTPSDDFNGSDSFTFKANDGLVDSNIATINITVNPVNDAPVAAADAYTTDEDITLTIAVPGILANDTDVDSDPLTAALDSGPSNGTLTLNSDGSFTYTPNAGFTGDDTFTYTANDGTDNSNVATVTITVNAAAPPFATCGGYDVLETAPGVYEAPEFAGMLHVGTSGYDWLQGTDGPDLMLGLGGPDDIWGKDGDDIICGGAGVDIILGQRGSDILYGDDQPDWLIGGPGNDILYGGKGWDDLEGNSGQDMLYGDGGYDVLVGGSDSDQLFGGTGPDDLYGNKGDDDLNGGDGNDYCKGGSGNDTVNECEGASAASLSAEEKAEVLDGEAVRRSNDGENGEHRIERRIQDLYLPMITSSGQ
ncbi:MAG: Ig-like domain-containing protein [Chloroflexota bacterium]